MMNGDRVNFVASQALARRADLSNDERLALFEGLAFIFERCGLGAEAEQARLAADAIRHADEAQLLLADMLGAERSDS